MVPVRRAAVPVVDAVDVIAVRDGHMPAAGPVNVIAVIFGDDMLCGVALDPFAVDLAVDVAIVHVIDVVSVCEGAVAAAVAMLAPVIVVDVLSGAHDVPFGCRPRAPIPRRSRQIGRAHV